MPNYIYYRIQLLKNYEAGKTVLSHTDKSKVSNAVQIVDV